ncbi:MAG TPA: diadenylate cyclase CdaA, partial [candidate division Zixibacteria bacterium]|nr:diadenylate cyclase CdaA [candidate division Zixibacteria bacterium]MDD4916424.1 diadenylate cyclase CdaA [candidate division Zixibacteria bacterium]MDM7972563.1 diadenylate cyclase CdaA [candidate division Zixibacteria bacterium]HOD65651.1 diadenylate cyclase CdaA [candidate division Zixibacteria bacterium]HOZ09074.1 diadenylate cyclase CdaA [candidate division Zixibacteria bacterium]
MSLFSWGFVSFGLKDLIDVLIVSFIIYEALKLMKGTRSAQIIVGLFLVAGVAFIAYWFQLEGLTWLFSNLATFGLIVLVVVFQPELRGVLAQLGQRRFFRRFVQLERKKSLEEVSRAALRLSELRYGGLVVIERRTGLRNFAESGKLVNAELSSELLVTLFTPYTPLHDGAVIISGEYIVAASASLPLTTNPRYRKLYGMRHKAAIGVSEISDAVVVVVSEETTGISIAYNGGLEKDIKKSEFRDKLASYLAR